MSLHDAALEGEVRDRMGLVADMLLEVEDPKLASLSGALMVR